jgi:predicted nucleic acid-binding protein
MYLIDTNIMSELLRPKPDRGVLRWAASQSQFKLAAISVEEAIFGLTRKKNRELREGFERFVQNRCRVLAITEEVARRAGALRGEFEKRGLVRSQPDMLIAATAQAHALTVVTRNVRDFAGCGIGILNPFGDVVP